MALQVSSSLLLGIVRIYSNKTDQLFLDCNDFSESLKVLLASFRKARTSASLSGKLIIPDRFELDAQSISDNLSFGTNLDHVVPNERITLPDYQTPQDPFVSFFNNMGMGMDVFAPMEEDDIIMELKNDDNNVSDHESRPQVEQLSEIEVMRDTNNNMQFEVGINFSLSITRSTSTNNQLLEIGDDDEDGPSTGNTLAFEGEPDIGVSPTPTPLSHRYVLASGGEPDVGNETPVSEYQPTPRVRSSKEKKRPNVSSNRMCKRRTLRISDVGVRSVGNRTRKSNVTSGSSLLHGLSANLQNIFNKDYVVSRASTISLREGIPQEPTNPINSTPISENNIVEEEGPRFQNVLSENDIISEDQNVSVDEDLSVHETTSLGEPSATDSQLDLSFLDADIVQTGDEHDYEEEIEQVNDFTAKTRDFAQYLKDKVRQSTTLDRQMGNLSLNEILQGKTREQSAHMFYETLVLKNHNMNDVKQEEAYGDITLSVDPELE